MTLLSLLCLPASGFSFWLAGRAYTSKFWAIGADTYGFNAGQLAYGSLIAIGIVSIMLCLSGLSLVKHPEDITRYFGTIMSLLLSLGLLAGGISAVN